MNESTRRLPVDLGRVRWFVHKQERQSSVMALVNASLHPTFSSSRFRSSSLSSALRAYGSTSGGLSELTCTKGRSFETELLLGDSEASTRGGGGWQHIPMVTFDAVVWEGPNALSPTHHRSLRVMREPSKLTLPAITEVP